VKRLAVSSVAAMVALPGTNAVEQQLGVDPPQIPEAVKEVVHLRDAELARAKRDARKAKRLARRRLREVVKLRGALRTQVRLGGASGLERGLLCVHEHEGSWRDAGWPYWGGLQMDRSFMATYGAPFYRAFGTADRWTPAMQIATAERAVLSGKSFASGWPNTSRMCGL
jgi:hypothetical protein